MPTSRRVVDSEGEDFYPTPAWATRALIACEKFVGPIWEPACGNGAMSEILKETGNTVFSSDLFDRNYGNETKADFTQAPQTFQTSNIITNPPYNLAEAFVASGLRLAQKKLALLLRLSFLESARRYESIFKPNPPTTVWVFSERITFYPSGIQTGGTGTLAYAWFVWNIEDPDLPCELKWIPPIFKDSTNHPTGSGSIIDIDL